MIMCTSTQNSILSTPPLPFLNIPKQICPCWLTIPNEPSKSIRMQIVIWNLPHINKHKGERKTALRGCFFPHVSRQGMHLKQDETDANCKSGPQYQTVGSKTAKNIHIITYITLDCLDLALDVQSLMIVLLYEMALWQHEKKKSSCRKLMHLWIIYLPKT